MQFKRVAIGQQFRWQGQLYLKTSPLTATPQAGGKQKMIAQSAKILLVGQALATTSDDASVRFWDLGSVEKALPLGAAVSDRPHR